MTRRSGLSLPGRGGAHLTFNHSHQPSSVIPGWAITLRLLPSHQLSTKGSHSKKLHVLK